MPLPRGANIASLRCLSASPSGYVNVFTTIFSCRGLNLRGILKDRNVDLGNATTDTISFGGYVDTNIIPVKIPDFDVADDS